MFTAVPIDVLLNKAQVRLIDQGSRLQCVVRPLPPHVGVGNAMKLCVNEGQESFGRCLIAGMHGLEKPRRLASIFIHGNVQGAGSLSNAPILVPEAMTMSALW
jgi:hypothetical protein